MSVSVVTSLNNFLDIWKIIRIYPLGLFHYIPHYKFCAWGSSQTTWVDPEIILFKFIQELANFNINFIWLFFFHPIIPFIKLKSVKEIGGGFPCCCVSIKESRDYDCVLFVIWEFMNKLNFCIISLSVYSVFWRRFDLKVFKLIFLFWISLLSNYFIVFILFCCYSYLIIFEVEFSFNTPIFFV